MARLLGHISKGGDSINRDNYRIPISVFIITIIFIAVFHSIITFCTYNNLHNNFNMESLISNNCQSSSHLPLIMEDLTKVSKIIFVNRSGEGDYTNIQWAIDNASEGDTIYVEAGTYNENIIINKSINLLGTSKEHTRIIGEGPLLSIYANKVTISTFNITGSILSNIGFGIYIENVNYCNILDNICSSNSYCGIALNNVTNSIIANNICNSEGIEPVETHPRGGIGISINSSNNITILKNICSNNTWCGIKINNTNYSQFIDNMCLSNGGKPTQHMGGPSQTECGTGIYIFNSDNNIIRDNQINNSYRLGAMSGDCAGIAVIYSNVNEIYDNQINNSMDYGVLLYKSNRNVVRDNYFSENGWFGIRCYHSSFNVIIKNFIQLTRTLNDIELENASFNIVNKNLCINKSVFLWYNSSMNTIIGNYIPSGLRIDEEYNLPKSRFNRLHHNNLINTTYMTSDYGKFNIWNDSFGEGNYWSDFHSRYPNATNDGTVWDMPYEIFGQAKARDHYPLVRPVDNGTYFPVAIIDPPREFDQFETHTFDGSRCFDYLGITNYTWHLSHDDGDNYLYGPAPEFTFQHTGRYNLSLTITNVQGNRDRVYSSILVRDREPPVANAGPDASIDQFRMFSFNASLCSDNVGIVNYTWSFRYDDMILTRYDRSFQHRFDIPGTYGIELNVSDAEGNRATDAMVLMVRDIMRPHFHGFDDVVIDQFETLSLDARVCSDNVGIANYSWFFIYNDVHLVLYGNYTSFTFVIPGKYIITLNVTDAAGNWIISTLNVTVLDITPPVAEAGNNITTFVGMTVFLDANYSSDNVGIVNYTWSFHYNDTEISLYRINGSFTFYIPGNYPINLTVRDGTGNLAWDNLTVTILADPLPLDSDGDTFNDTYENKSGSDPFDPLSTPLDLDGDGWNNSIEVQAGTDPYRKESVPPDMDGDGIPDVLDADRDGDGVANWEDAFPDDGGRWEREKGGSEVVWWVVGVVVVAVVVVGAVAGVVLVRRRRRGEDEVGEDGFGGDDVGRVKDGEEDASG